MAVYKVQVRRGGGFQVGLFQTIGGEAMPVIVADCPDLASLKAEVSAMGETAKLRRKLQAEVRLAQVYSGRDK